MIDRRALLGSILAAPLVNVVPTAHATPSSPLLQRIRIATVATPDVTASEKLYQSAFDYRTREARIVPPSLAASWGAPATTGRPSVLMSSNGDPDIYIRLVEAETVPGYTAMTTLGWNAIEIVVDDIDDIHARMQESPFTILAPPLPLDGYPSIIAMQVKGPANDVFYLTMQSGDRSKSSLPDPKAPVGRPFIAVLAGLDMETMLHWYEEHFALIRRNVMETPIAILQEAQGLPPSHLFPMGTMGLAQHGNIIEFDVYPAAPGIAPVRKGNFRPATQCSASASRLSTRSAFLSSRHPAHLAGWPTAAAARQPRWVRQANSLN